MRDCSDETVAELRGQPRWYGFLERIFICAVAGEEMHELEKAALVEDRGIEGDRYFLGTGHYSSKPHSDRQVTIIEQETLDALARDHGLELLPEECRRNLITVGVPLSHLVGKQAEVDDPGVDARVVDARSRFGTLARSVIWYW